MYEDSFLNKFDECLAYSDLVWENNAVLEYVPIDLLVSPQEEVDKDRVDEIADSGYFDGAMGLRFKGNDEVCIVEGNHRVNAAIQSGKQQVLISIVSL